VKKAVILALLVSAVVFSDFGQTPRSQGEFNINERRRRKGEPGRESRLIIHFLPSEAYPGSNPSVEGRIPYAARGRNHDT
jgi:hypothetical protein